MQHYPSANIRVLLMLALIPLGLVLSGCGTGDGKASIVTVPVSGTVYMDDKPLAGAEVVFLNGEFASNAKSNAEGKYQLVLGAVPGENKVFVTKWLGDKMIIDPEAGMDEGQFEAMQQAAGSGAASTAPKQIVPARFSDPERTEIKYPVPEGGTQSADLRIQSS